MNPVHTYLLDVIFICGHTETTSLIASNFNEADRLAAFASLKICTACRLARLKELA